MAEIKCPNCNKVFKVDEGGYASILQQVRNQEFHNELKRREAELEERKEGDIQLVKLEGEKNLQSELAKKDQVYNDTYQKYTKAYNDQKAEIESLKSQISNFEAEKNLAVSEAKREANQSLSDKDMEIEKLRSQISNFEAEKNLAVSEAMQKSSQALNDKEMELAKLKSQIGNFEAEKKLALSEVERQKEQELNAKNNELTKLQGELTNKANEYGLKERSLIDKYSTQLKEKDELINYYKDFKAKQSTKMIGESLEQHCYNEFNRYRVSMFPNAYFEKDNDASSGSKGDFIYREKSVDGTEFISIMFEMKNEADTTATKHKNEDFYKELDKDRREKNCEYAILVSLLEADNEYFNEGIVDVSYRYEKMYVIRPQFFIPMITLLRNAALSTVKYKQELEVIKNQQLDISHFEENMNAFKDAFGKNYDIASRKFTSAIDNIDKTIKYLEKVKADLTSSENNLRLANNKAQELTVKKLTKNAPSVKAMFDAKDNDNK